MQGHFFIMQLDALLGGFLEPLSMPHVPSDHSCPMARQWIFVHPNKSWLFESQPINTGREYSSSQVSWLHVSAVACTHIFHFWVRRLVYLSSVSCVC